MSIEDYLSVDCVINNLKDGNHCPPPVLYTIPVLVDSKVNLENSGVLIPDGMLAKVAGSNQFKVGQGDKTWNELEFVQPDAIQLGGGLATDQEGKIYVDFSQMPTDKFEALLKQIRVPIWLSANTNFYVDGATGSDVLSSGRGLSADMAFKTIQACVNYVCDNYNLSRYSAIILIADGVYKETLTLPEYQSSTGIIYIRPRLLLENFTVIIESPNNFYGKLISLESGKKYAMQNLKIVYKIYLSAFTVDRWITNIFVSNSSSLTLATCWVEFSLDSIEDLSNLNYVHPTVFSVNKNAELAISKTNYNYNYTMYLKTDPNLKAIIFYAAASGFYTFYGSSKTDKILCNTPKFHTFVFLNPYGAIFTGDASSGRNYVYEIPEDITPEGNALTLANFSTYEILAPVTSIPGILDESKISKFASIQGRN